MQSHQLEDVASNASSPKALTAGCRKTPRCWFQTMFFLQKRGSKTKVYGIRLGGENTSSCFNIFF